MVMAAVCSKSVGILVFPIEQCNNSTKEEGQS